MLFFEGKKVTFLKRSWYLLGSSFRSVRYPHGRFSCVKASSGKQKNWPPFRTHQTEKSSRFIKKSKLLSYHSGEPNGTNKHKDIFKIKLQKSSKLLANSIFFLLHKMHAKTSGKNICVLQKLFLLKLGLETQKSEKLHITIIQLHCVQFGAPKNIGAVNTKLVFTLW